NAEELINIQGIENAIREQSGMHKRQYHKPQENVLGLRRKVDLQGRYFQKANLDPLLIEFSEFAEVNTRLNQAIRANTLHDDTVYNGLRGDIVGLDAVCTNERIAEFKEGKMAERLAEVKAMVPQQQFDDYVANSAEWLEFTQWVDDEWDTLVGVGNDKIRDYNQKANTLKANLPTIAARERKAAKKEAARQARK